LKLHCLNPRNFALKDFCYVAFIEIFRKDSKKQINF
jgi:hypothetical protein